MSAPVSAEVVRDILADEIADAGAGCIARVARTATTPAAWRMVAADLVRWEHPTCPADYAVTLAAAAKGMARGDAAHALWCLSEHWGEGEELVAVECGIEPKATPCLCDDTAARDCSGGGLPRTQRGRCSCRCHGAETLPAQSGAEVAA